MALPHAAVTGLLALSLMSGCADEVLDPAGRHPSLIVQSDQRGSLLERTKREPYAAILQHIEQTAARPYEKPDASVWDHRTIGRNNTVAQANAFVAWLKDDEAAARKAVEFLLRMPTDFENNVTWDVNIRMPHVMMTYCYAWDLLSGTGWMSDEEAAEARRRVLAVNEKFFFDYVENSLTRQAVLGFAQNNHPIRTAASIGLVAMTFPDHPASDGWANWAVSELDYLMGPDGQYLQPDGGVSEGPFYYGFAFGPAVAFFIAMDKAVDPSRQFRRDCRNRQKVEPWRGHDCVEGELFTFENPLHGDLLAATIDWSINLRLPTGWRAPLADGNFIHHNGGPLLTSYGGGSHLLWDWETRPTETARAMTFGMDLTLHHLAYLDDEVAAAPPPWTNRFLPEAGNAVFRSGWDEEARWLLLVAEQGAARKTLHDHVDGTSFTLAAYGEYLLVDPGYHKPNELDNAITSPSQAHNLILVEGEGAPDKGLLHDFGDADAFLENTADGARLAYAEAHQRYRDTDFERSIVFVRGRYFVVGDRLRTDAEIPREHAWRLGGWAGLDAGGTFDVWDCSGEACGARFQRQRAGVDVHLGSTAPGLSVVEPAHDPLQAPHVGAFDEDRVLEDHGVIDGLVTGLAPGYLAILAPYAVGASGDEAPLMVTALEAGSDAVAWLVEGDGQREVVWLRAPTAASTLAAGPLTLESDGELVVASLDGSFGLVARGSTVTLEGSPLVSGEGPITLWEEP